MAGNEQQRNCQGRQESVHRQYIIIQSFRLFDHLHGRSTEGFPPEEPPLPLPGT